jgi:hypothetical protein
VLGIDVGFSEKRRTTCFCLLRWERDVATLTFRTTTSDPAKRRAALSDLLSDNRRVEAVAVDGPLGPSLCALTEYRSAEALLSQGAMQKRGKPGQTSSPTGQLLHQHATALAVLALELCDVAEAAQSEPIHPKRVVEAFPNAYLAAMMEESDFNALSRNASDVFWRRLCQTGALARLSNQLLPGRTISPALDRVTDHEERAGIICALTALSVVRGAYVAVGDPVCGDIILPPVAAWGMGPDGEPWLRTLLNGAAERIRGLHVSRRGFRQARMNYYVGAAPRGAA